MPLLSASVLDPVWPGTVVAAIAAAGTATLNAAPNRRPLRMSRCMSAPFGEPGVGFASRSLPAPNGRPNDRQICAPPTTSVVVWPPYERAAAAAMAHRSHFGREAHHGIHPKRTTARHA